MRDLSEVTVINFWAGPGAGKSTLAANLFSVLKDRGITCELVTEYAKRKTYERDAAGAANSAVLDNQFYVSAKQYHELLTVAQTCNLIITDSPLLLGAVYGGPDDTLLEPLLQGYMQRFKNFNVWINRDASSYDPTGRSQTLEESIALDVKIEEIVARYFGGPNATDDWDRPLNCSGFNLGVDYIRGRLSAISDLIISYL